MQETEEKDIFDLNRDHNSQVLLSKFLSGEIRTLEPVYDPQKGYRYPLVEDIVGDASQVEHFLDTLSGLGILDKKLYDKVILCPKCSSSNVSFRYCCPYCKSYDIQKSSLVEHVKCGYMDLETNFRQKTKYVCPKCHEEMRQNDVDYRKAGVWCTCSNCGKSFDIPVSEHSCRICCTVSTFEEAYLKEVFSYTLNKNIKSESTQNLSRAVPIREFFAKEGLAVESPAHLVGRSGAKHSFDVVAQKQNADNSRNLIVVDIAQSSIGMVSEQPVIALFAKVYDVSPERAYLVAIPRLNDNGRKMAELYNIITIEAENTSDAAKGLKTSLKE